MPEMNGDQLALEVKRRNPKMPVVLLTGYGDLMASEGEKPPGVDAIVSKPFTLESLRGAFRSVLPKA
jgi:two-component system response regulator AauR